MIYWNYKNIIEVSWHGKASKKYSNLSKSEIRFVKKVLNISKVQNIDTAILKKLKEALKQLSDIRQNGKIIYKLWDVMELDLEE